MSHGCYTGVGNVTISLCTRSPCVWHTTAINFDALLWLPVLNINCTILRHSLPNMVIHRTSAVANSYDCLIITLTITTTVYYATQVGSHETIQVFFSSLEAVFLGCWCDRFFCSAAFDPRGGNWYFSLILCRSSSFSWWNSCLSFFLFSSSLSRLASSCNCLCLAYQEEHRRLTSSS